MDECPVCIKGNVVVIGKDGKAYAFECPECLGLDILPASVDDEYAEKVPA